nr:protein takeout-like [Danaus plexippus plexippus]
MKGVPTLDVEVMDVLKLDELNFNLTGLVFTLRDGRLKGSKDIIVDNIEWDTKKLQAVINYHVNYCELWGSYTASGKILLLPIYGHGDLNIQFRKLYVKVTLYYDVYKKNGKSFARVKRYTNDFDVRESIRYNMTNLFNGNNELGTALLNVMNDNWEQVCKEFGKPLMDSVSKKILKNVNKFLSHSPLEEITLTYI